MRSAPRLDYLSRAFFTALSTLALTSPAVDWALPAACSAMPSACSASAALEVAATGGVVERHPGRTRLPAARRSRASPAQGPVGRSLCSCQAWFSQLNLKQMRAFCFAWPPEHIAQTLSAQIGMAVSVSRSGPPLELASPRTRQRCSSADRQPSPMCSDRKSRSRIRSCRSRRPQGRVLRVRTRGRPDPALEMHLYLI